MAPRQTRERILETSLAMFNAQGEPNVTTNHIADELEISPGNLYYHFRNKEDIVEQVFARYEARMDQALLVPEGRLPNLEDIWLQLHLVFECMWEYRFLYRDLVDIALAQPQAQGAFRAHPQPRRGQRRRCPEGSGARRDPARDARRNPRHCRKRLALATFWLNFNAVATRRETDPCRKT